MFHTPCILCLLLCMGTLLPAQDFSPITRQLQPNGQTEALLLGLKNHHYDENPKQYHTYLIAEDITTSQKPLHKPYLLTPQPEGWLYIFPYTITYSEVEISHEEEEVFYDMIVTTSDVIAGFQSAKEIPVFIDSMKKKHNFDVYDYYQQLPDSIKEGNAFMIGADVYSNIKYLSNGYVTTIAGYNNIGLAARAGSLIPSYTTYELSFAEKVFPGKYADDTLYKNDLTYSEASFDHLFTAAERHEIKRGMWFLAEESMAYYNNSTSEEYDVLSPGGFNLARYDSFKIGESPFPNGPYSRYPPEENDRIQYLIERLGGKVCLVAQYFNGAPWGDLGQAFVHYIIDSNWAHYTNNVIPLSEFQAVDSTIVDRFISPGQNLIYMLHLRPNPTSQYQRQYELSCLDVKSGKIVSRQPLPKGEIIMEEWATGKHVNSWIKQMEESPDSLPQLHIEIGKINDY